MSKLVYIAGKYTSDSVSTTIHYVNLAVETAKIVFEKTNFIPVIHIKLQNYGIMIKDFYIIQLKTG